MTSIELHSEKGEQGETLFRAVAGERQSVGRTMGEALDALTAEWGAEIEEAAVLIRRFQPDRYFTAEQHDRMQALLARRTTLTSEERAELESLIDAELEATIARTDPVAPQTEP